MRFRGFRSRARRMRATVLFAPALAAAACSSPTDGGVVCTSIFLYGISATVTDAVTGSDITAGSSLIVREGTYVDSVTAGPGGTLSAAGERPGTYNVTVRRAAYLPFAKNAVRVNSDACHVIPVKIQAALSPADTF